MTYDNKITVSFDIFFTEINEVKWERKSKTLTINMNDGRHHNFYGDKGLKIYKILCRNYPGEHID